MQIAVIEFAQSVLGVHDATSTEFDPETKSPCVIYIHVRGILSHVFELLIALLNIVLS